MGVGCVTVKCGWCKGCGEVYKGRVSVCGECGVVMRDVVAKERTGME